MPRALSAAAKQRIFADGYGGAAIVLLTIDHPSLLGSVVRLARNNENVTSRGETFLAFPFEITLPSDEDGRIGNAQLTIDNIDRTLLVQLGSITTPPDVTLEVVLSESPDVVDMSVLFTWGSTQFGPALIVAELIFDDLLNQRFPQNDFTPSSFEGLF